LTDVLLDVRRAVQDWKKMLLRLEQVIAELEKPSPVPATQRREAQAFLRWLQDQNFTFLGYQELQAGQEDEKTILRSIPGSALGIAKRQREAELFMPSGGAARRPELLFITKSIQRSTVHRPGYLDYIAIRH